MLYEELHYEKTPLGELVLRRRASPSVPDAWVYEVTLNHEMLMSSTVNLSERALARLALDALGEGPLDVLVGGLGLGHTAAAALEAPNVRRLVVVERLGSVIAWHRRRMVPMADTLLDDPRCELVEADFFELIRSPDSTERYDAILLDIDHAPDCWLCEEHQAFYRPEGLRGSTARLKPKGVFALWSAWEPADDFLGALRTVFASVENHPVTFFNPHSDKNKTNWILLAREAQAPGVV